MDILWQYTGMARTLDFNFQYLPEIIAGDSLTGTPTMTYSPNDGALTISNVVIKGNKVYGKFQADPTAAGHTYSITCNVQTLDGENLTMIGQLQIF